MGVGQISSITFSQVVGRAEKVRIEVEFMPWSKLLLGFLKVPIPVLTLVRNVAEG